MNDTAINIICEGCGKPKWNDGRTTADPEICECSAKTAQLGWICPVCGAGRSPTVDRCDCIDDIKFGTPQWTGQTVMDGTSGTTVKEMDIIATNLGNGILPLNCS